MSTNQKFILLTVCFVLALIVLTVTCCLGREAEVCSEPPIITEGLEPEQIPAQGLMILIEYRDTVGLVNFVNEMQQRGVTGLLHLDPDFVVEHCDTVKRILDYGLEVMASVPGEPLWGQPYEVQKAAIQSARDQIEACTGQPVRIISSRYMASDINTLKAAEELGIPYITARGTTDTKATVYAMEGHQTKILSVSNIPQVEFKYGSLCDYSYYERSGQPEDMMAELKRALEPLTEKEKARYGSYHRVDPVSHTNIGGYLKPWMDMWIEFWDTTQDQIVWVGLDDFMADADWLLPDWQLPINLNAPYTPDKIRPLIPYEDVEKVDNPCRVEDLGGRLNQASEATDDSLPESGDRIRVFHNGQGEMCLEALDFFTEINYPIEEFLETEPGFYQELNRQMATFDASEGVSEDFGYYPIIFIKNRAFSGFNDAIRNDILEVIE
mgnify:CR=1 FL=1